MSFEVSLAPSALTDLVRLFDFLLERAESPADLDRAQAAIDAVRVAAHRQLAVTPYSFRKAHRNPAQRELIIPFGSTGYVALYEIVGPSQVVVLAFRHQREEDFH